MLRAYHGSVSEASYSQVPCHRLVPQPSGHLRVHTRISYQAPLTAHWWAYVFDDRGSHALDGLHTHFGHLGNNYNLQAQLVRRDERAKVTFEHGPTNGYADLVYGAGLPLRKWRRYLFTLDWDPGHVRLAVTNDHSPVERAEIEAPLPSHAPRFGHLGFRFDKLSVYLGGLVVRER